MSSGPLLALLLVVGLGIIALLAWFIRGAVVDRQRVDRFARRQRLRLTADNGPYVVRALTVTRQWRRLGLVVGLVVAGLWAAAEGGLRIDFVAMFLGWFVGAVVAEWRMSSGSNDTGQRRAVLATRSLATYLTRPNRALFWMVAGALMLGLVAAGVVAISQGEWQRWLAHVVFTAMATAALWVTTRRVLERPQSFVSQDLRDADDALRSQALTVLVGSAIAASAVPAGEFATTAVAHVWADDAGEMVGFLAFLGLVLLGWFVAAASRSVRAADVGAPVSPAARTP